MKMRFTVLLFAFPLLVCRVRGADPVTVEITDEVLVPATERLGVHFSGHNYYDAVILKQRAAENFEGSIYRAHLIGPEQKEADVFVPHNAIADPETELHP